MTDRPHDSKRVSAFHAACAILITAAAMWLADERFSEQFEHWSLFGRFAALLLIGVFVGQFVLSMLSLRWVGAAVGSFVGGVGGGVGGMYVELREKYLDQSPGYKIGYWIGALAVAPLWLPIFLSVWLALFVLGASSIFGVSARALVIKLVATLKTIEIGVQVVPVNWRNAMLRTVSFVFPELIPTHHYSEPDYLRKMAARWMQSIQANWGHHGAVRVLMLFGFPILYAPALLWRWSIKSTGWFYLPLLWVGRGWQNIHGHALQLWASAFASTNLNRLGVILAVTGLAASAFALFMLFEFLKLSARLEAAGAPMSPVGYLLVLDWAELLYQPWKWFFLAGWLLTIALYFMLDHHAKHIKAGADADALEPTFRVWMWLSNQRYVLTNLGLLVALVWFLHAVGAVGAGAGAVFLTVCVSSPLASPAVRATFRR